MHSRFQLDSSGGWRFVFHRRIGTSGGIGSLLHEITDRSGAFHVSFTICHRGLNADFVLFRLPDPPEWSGPLAENAMLQSAKRLLEGEILGPEAISYHNGNYSALWCLSFR